MSFFKLRLNIPGSQVILERGWENVTWSRNGAQVQWNVIFHLMRNDVDLEMMEERVQNHPKYQWSKVPVKSWVFPRYLKRIKGIYALPRVKWTASGKLLYSPGSSAQGSVTTKRGGVGGRDGGRLKGERMYIQLSHFAVLQKPPSHCKTIRFQLNSNHFISLSSLAFLFHKIASI